MVIEQSLSAGAQVKYSFWSIKLLLSRVTSKPLTNRSHFLKSMTNISIRFDGSMPPYTLCVAVDIVWKSVIVLKVLPFWMGRSLAATLSFAQPAYGLAKATA